jgi:hypothetical protein
MKFKLELILNKPRAEVWKAFTNPSNMSKWQSSLTKTELLSGMQGQPGAVSKLTFEENGREFSLIEKVTTRDEPNQYDVVYENEFTDNPMRHSFKEQGDNETLWIVEAEFKFKTFAMKLLGPLLKKNFVRRTQKDMGVFQTS